MFESKINAFMGVWETLFKISQASAMKLNCLKMLNYLKAIKFQCKHIKNLKLMSIYENIYENELLLSMFT